MKVRIFPPEDMIEGKVELPVSKSVANRRLIIDAISDSPFPELVPDLCGKDICILYDALKDSSASYVNVGLAGTAMRFLTAYYASCPGRQVVLDGNDRMRQRPIGPLVEALQALGADIEYAGEVGYPPLRIRGCQLRGGKISIDATVSSQYISALMMVGPYMTEGLDLNLEGVVSSEPYICLTVDMMARRGADVEYDRGEHRIKVHHGIYLPDSSQTIERDWSALSFWAELVAITAGWISVEGLDPNSAQADRLVLDLFGELGCGEAESDEDDEDNVQNEDVISLCGSPELTPRLVYDFRANPDLAQPAIVACCMIGVPFRASGLHSLVIKETDRITALMKELRKVGFILEREDYDVLKWDGLRVPVADLPQFDSHGDHRMAMSLAAVAAFVPGVTIDGAECIDKSYPGFWDQFASLGFTVEEVTPTCTEAGQI